LNLVTVEFGVGDASYRQDTNVAYQPKPRGHRANLRSGRVSQPGCTYLITKCALSEQSTFLSRPDCAEAVLESFRWAQSKRWWTPLGFVIMPNHYHIIIGLGDLLQLSECFERLGRFTAGRINILLGRSGAFWEEGYYDHAIRDRRDYDGILQYIHQNPVEAGYSQLAEEWPHSTAHARFSNEIDWDWIGVSMKHNLNGQHFRKEDVPSRYL
jgi:putative transposase